MRAADLLFAAAGSNLPVTFVNSASTQNGSTGTSLVINKPTGTVDGDLMVAFLSPSGGTLSGGFTTAPSWTTALNDGSRIGPAVFWKIASSEGSSYTWNTGTSRTLAGTILTYRNATFGEIGAPVTGSNPLVLSSLTTFCAGSVLLAFGGRDVANITVTSSMNSVVIDADATSPSYGIFSETVGAGSTGTRSITVGNTTNVSGVMCYIFPSWTVVPAPQPVATSSTQNPTPGTSLVINKPTGTVDGDLMVAIVAGGGSSSITWTGDTGWTETYDQNGKPGVRIAWKIAASEGSSYTFTSSGSDILSGSIITFRSAAYGVTGTAQTASNPIVAPSITTLDNFSTVVGVFMRTVASITITTPTNMTALITDNDATTPSYLIATGVKYTAGATGTYTADATANGNNLGILFSIKPV